MQPATPRSTTPRRPQRRVRLVVLGLGAGAAVACADVLGADFDGYDKRPVPPGNTPSGTRVPTRFTHTPVDKVDLLFVVANNPSMTDKQEILIRNAPDLPARLINPPCVDPGSGATLSQPAGPNDACPSGQRAFAPIKDIHVGMVTSSLGGHGADSCSEASSLWNPRQNDRGHLVALKADGSPLATWSDKGFLAWDPDGNKVPAGQSDSAAFLEDVGTLIGGAGDQGCGFESTLEAMYRFLVEPNPYESIVLDPPGNPLGNATLVGTDQTVLDQRAAFLRPDSLLVVVILSDQNDCSVRDGGQYQFALRTVGPAGPGFTLPRGSSACAQDPEDACCYPCTLAAPEGCPPTQDDPACQVGQTLTFPEDQPNIRCFDQKRRFGIDFLQPISRYVQGLTSPAVIADDGSLQPNPVFSDLSGSGAPVRDRSRVVVTGLVGVPWQDVVSSASLTDVDNPRALSGAEFRAAGRWDVVLGDPRAQRPPTDPLMRESVDPRSGTHPLTGVALAPPSATARANSINGHERELSTRRDDLQLACIADISTPRDCLLDFACACFGDTEVVRNPVCQDLVTGEYDNLQRATIAYPGTRILQVLEGLGDTSVVGSICSPNQTDPQQNSFGFRYAFEPITDQLESAVSNVCLSKPVQPESDGSVNCALIEAIAAPDAGCNCTTAGRFRPTEPNREAAVTQLVSDGLVGYECLCEIEQLQDAKTRASCQSADTTPDVAGWCYVSGGVTASDGTGFEPVGAAKLVSGCPADSRHAIRFTDSGQPRQNAVTVLVCDSKVLEATPVCTPGFCGACKDDCSTCLCLTNDNQEACSGNACPAN